MAFDITQSAYEDFREILKQRTNQVIVWCGAGLSAPARLPTWLQLRTELVAECHKRLAVADPDVAKRIEAYVDLADAEPNAWEAFAFLKKALGESSYAAAIRS